MGDVMTTAHEIAVGLSGHPSGDTEIVDLIRRMRAVCVGEAKLAMMLEDENDDPPLPPADVVVRLPSRPEAPVFPGS